MPQNNPKQESNVKQRSNSSYAGNSANGQEAELYGELETRLSWYVRYAEREQYDLMEHTIDSLIQFINAHTTKLLNEQLDRIGEPTLNDIVLDDPKSYQDTLKIVRWYKSAIENERKRL